MKPHTCFLLRFLCAVGTNALCAFASTHSTNFYQLLPTSTLFSLHSPTPPLASPHAQTKILIQGQKVDPFATHHSTTHTMSMLRSYVIISFTSFISFICIHIVHIPTLVGVSSFLRCAIRDTLSVACFHSARAFCIVLARQMRANRKTTIAWDGARFG